MVFGSPLQILVTQRRGRMGLHFNSLTRILRGPGVDFQLCQRKVTLDIYMKAEGDSLSVSTAA